MKHNHRNYLQFWAELVFATKATVIFLILLFSLVSFTNCYMISEMSKYNKVIDRSHEMQLEGRYFYQLGFSSLNFKASDYERLLNLRLESKNIRDVTFLNFYSGDGAEGEYNNWDKFFFIYNLSDSHDDPTKILTVHDINNIPVNSLEINHVLLDESARKIYKTGDHINLYIEYKADVNDHNLTDACIDVVVDGFIRRDEVIIDTSHGTLVDLSSVFTTVLDPTDTTAEALNAGWPAYFCFCSVLSDNGHLINFNEDMPLLLIITPEEGVDQGSFINDIEQSGLKPQELVSYEQLLNNYQDSHADELRLIKTFGIAIIILTICVVLTVFVGWYTYKRNELGIFVLSGCPWKAAILLSASPYYFSILIGGFLGFSVWSMYEKFYRFELNTIGWKTAGLLMTVYIFIYSLGVFIYYFMFKRCSPVELYRTRE